MMKLDIYWCRNLDIIAVGIDFLWGAFVAECWHTGNLQWKCRKRYPELRVVIWSYTGAENVGFDVSRSGE